MSRNSFYKENISLKNRLSFKGRFVTEHFLGKTFLKKGIRNWEKKNKRKINEQLAKSDHATVMHIDCYQGEISPERFRRDYVKKGRPVLVKGGATNWKSTQEWDFEFFKTNYGDHPVILTNSKELGDKVDQETEITTLKDIIDGLDQKSTKYARFNPLLNQYPELTKSFDQAWLGAAMKKPMRPHFALFIGNQGTKTNVHNAGDENIFVQVEGKKKWFLWDQQAILGINPTVNRAPAKGVDTNPYEGDEINFGFTKMPRYEVELEPGDMLYIPSYLWHYVENTTASIGVGIRWMSLRNSAKNLPMLAFLELFNTSPSIFKIIKMNRLDRNDFNEILEIMKETQRKKDAKEQKEKLA